MHFDQCQLGQCVAKPTVIATDLPLRHWDGLVCDHEPHSKPDGLTSRDLSRYPPRMMHRLARAILTHTHQLQTHHPHLGSELTAYNPQWRTPYHMSQTGLRLHLLLGFKLSWTLQFWPVGTEGGNRGQGRNLPLSENHRLRCTSIQKQDKSHPFPEDLLDQVRSLVGETPSTPPTPGQPFYLDHIHTMHSTASSSRKESEPPGAPEPWHMSNQGRTARRAHIIVGLALHVHMGLALHVQMGSAQTLSSKHQWARRTSVPRLWKRRRSPWYTGAFHGNRGGRLLSMPNLRTLAGSYRQPSTKGTRSVLSMTVPGVEPMLIYRQIVRREPQHLRCWTG